jgi:hypothetical protein
MHPLGAAMGKFTLKTYADEALNNDLFQKKKRQ